MNQFDKLGNTLRKTPILKENHLKELEDFRKLFVPFGDSVFCQVENALLPLKGSIKYTRRSTKTRQSIIDKLKREKTLRLSTIQDIEGCRIVRKDPLLIQEIVDILEKRFYPDTKTISRNHSSGYQAIHLIIKQDRKRYEIQLRTLCEDVWANTSEGVSGEKNEFKYGIGDSNKKLKMLELSKQFALLDEKSSILSEEDLIEKINKAIENVLSD